MSFLSVRYFASHYGQLTKCNVDLILLLQTVKSGFIVKSGVHGLSVLTARLWLSLTYCHSYTTAAAAAAAATTILRPFFWDYPGELVLEETFTRSHLS